jgi:hypothetical protein
MAYFAREALKPVLGIDFDVGNLDDRSFKNGPTGAAAPGWWRGPDSFRFGERLRTEVVLSDEVHEFPVETNERAEEATA